MIPALAALLSVAAAALVALAGYSSGLVLAGAVGLAVLAMAAGWGRLLDLPAPVGSGLLVGGTGLAALGVAVAEKDSATPLSAFAAVIAGAVLAAFAHELLRRDGRPDLVESITGTLTGQVIAVLAAGWLLLPQTGPGAAAVLVTAVAVGAARLATALPLGPAVTPWAGLALGIGAAGATTQLVTGVTTQTAATIGVAVAAVVAALERLLGPDTGLQRSTGLLAGAAAPVAVAGTVAYAAVRLVMS